MKRSVREAALSSQSYYPESSQDSRSDDSSEHYFIPVPGVGFPHLGSKPNLLRSKKLLASEPDSSFYGNHLPQSHVGIKSDGLLDLFNDLRSLDDYDGIDSFLSTMGSNSSVSDACRSFYDMEEAEEQVFSPPLLMDTSLLAESYEDLLGMCEQLLIVLVFLLSHYYLHSLGYLSKLIFLILRPCCRHDLDS